MRAIMVTIATLYEKSLGALSRDSALRVVFLLVAGLMLGACQATDLPATATAEHRAAATQMGQIYNTATVARARLQTTLDFAGTRVAQIEQSGAFLRSNLSALGTDSAFIDETLRQALAVQAETAEASAAAPLPASADAANAASGPILTPYLASQPPSAATAAETGPRLAEAVLASGVNSEDCPLDVNPQFTTGSSAIYVVARAFDIPAGATFSSSWRFRDQEVASHSFRAEHSIHDNCIWFYIDQSDVIFSAGRWAVQLSLDGSALTPLLPFEVVDS